MDTNKWPPQESSGVYVKPMMEQLMNPNNSNSNMMNSNSSASIACPNNTHNMIKAPPTLERRGMRPPPQNKDQALHCPRCNSTNTKFCYYNNYSLTQPRYFCKTCRRYWTEGGSLRNVPVGGGSRKNKRPLTANNTTTANQLLSSSPSSTLSFLKIPAADNSNPPPSGISSLHDSHNAQNPRAGQDLNLTYLGLSQFVHHHGPNKSSIDQNSSSSNNNSTTTSSGAALELLRTGIASRGLGLGSYMPMVPAVPTPVSDSAGDNNTNSNGGIYSFHHQEYLRPPTLNFGVDHGVGRNNNNNNHNRFIGGVHLHHHHHQESGGGIGEGRMLFPFGEAKQISGGNGVSGGLELDQSTVQQGNNNNSSGWWNTSSTSNGMLGGGSW